MNSTKKSDYVYALRFRALDRLYDPIARLTNREAQFKRRVVARVAAQRPAQLLDLACGSGTLAIALQAACPEAEIHGLDGDAAMLAQARAKAAGAAIHWQQGLATALPYADGQFAMVTSTLFFHHLSRDHKRACLREIYRVLAPGGRLLIADWGPPSNPLRRAAFVAVQLLDGFANTADNVNGLLPALMREAGFEPVDRFDSVDTPLGTITLLEGHSNA